MSDVDPSESTYALATSIQEGLDKGFRGTTSGYSLTDEVELLRGSLDNIAEALNNIARAIRESAGAARGATPDKG